MRHEHKHTKKARAMLCRGGYKAGGHVHTDEAEDKALIKREVKKTALKRRHGGHAEGHHPKHRADKLARGGKTKGKGGKGHVTVNVINAHGGPKPMMAKPPMMPPPGIGSGGPPMPPPPGAMPPPMNKGGRARKSKIDSQRDTKGGMPKGHFRKGGKVKGYPIKDGSGGGEGRLEKIKAYGA